MRGVFVSAWCLTCMTLENYSGNHDLISILIRQPIDRKATKDSVQQGIQVNKVSFPTPDATQ